jgi:hypothetical protein
LLIDAATFVVLGIAGAIIHTGRRAHDAVAGAAAGATDASYSLRSDPLLWPLLVGLCALVLVGEVTNVVEVFLVRGALGAGPTAFGLVAATLAAGLVGGAVLAARARSQAALAQRVVLAAIVLGCLLVVAGSAPVLWVLAVAWAALGVGNGVVNVDVSTLLRERTPDSARGRVLAAVNGMIQRKHARRDGARWCRREPARSADDLRRLRGADGDDQCRVDRAGPPRNGHSSFAGGAGGRRTLRSFGTCTPRSGDARGGIGIRLRPPFQQNA